MKLQDTVVELRSVGWSVTDIARHLSISPARVERMLRRSKKRGAK